MPNPPSPALRTIAQRAVYAAHRRAHSLPPLPEAVIAAILKDDGPHPALPPLRQRGRPLPPLPDDDLSDILI